MPQILVTPENVDKTGNDIIKQKQEMEETIKRANSMVQSLKGEFKGNLANQVYGRWDEIYKDLPRAFERLQEAGDLLKKAAASFRQVDETKI